MPEDDDGIGASGFGRFQSFRVPGLSAVFRTTVLDFRILGDEGSEFRVSGLRVGVWDARFAYGPCKALQRGSYSLRASGVERLPQNFATSCGLHCKTRASEKSGPSDNVDLKP